MEGELLMDGENLASGLKSAGKQKSLPGAGKPGLGSAFAKRAQQGNAASPKSGTRGGGRRGTAGAPS